MFTSLPVSAVLELNLILDLGSSAYFWVRKWDDRVAGAALKVVGLRDSTAQLQGKLGTDGICLFSTRNGVPLPMNFLVPISSSMTCPGLRLRT